MLPHKERDTGLNVMTTGADYRGWEPKEIGFTQAAVMAFLLVGGIVAFCYWASVVLAPKPPMQVIQITQATLTQLPRPTPPPPKVVPPPKPIPAVIPKPPPVPSRIVVATKPPPPIRHIYKPVPHPVINHTPPPPTPAPVSQAPQPAAPPTNGIPIYGQQMYSIIQANQNVPPALAQLGVSGTAIIELMVNPDGSVASASVYKSSGIPLIDQTALEHARDAHFPAFNDEMPQTTRAFLVPVEIQPQE